MTMVDASRQVVRLALCHWRVWGATVTLGVCDLAMLTEARRRVEAEVAGMDAACNRFVATSDVSRVNRAAGRWVEVGPIFLDALGAALDAAAATRGAVDPTVGAALLRLGYDRDFDELAASGAKSSTQAGPDAVVGWQHVEVDRAGSRVRIPPGAALDLGATAKALCVDRSVAAASLLGAGALVDIGGDLAVAGEGPPDGWLVTVQESSREPLNAAAPVVAVTRGGLASSGTTVRVWHRGDEVVHHLVHPATGAPVASPWRMVTVAAFTCLEANVAATAAVVRGLDALADLAGSGNPARLVDQEGRVTVLGGWPADDPAGLRQHPSSSERNPP